MVSKASDDLPDPDTPVTTVSRLCGISKSIFLRLCTRAPRTTMLSLDIRKTGAPPLESVTGRTYAFDGVAESFDYRRKFRGMSCRAERSVLKAKNGFTPALAPQTHTPTASP